jgi:hypothetical protein
MFDSSYRQSYGFAATAVPTRASLAAGADRRRWRCNVAHGTIHDRVWVEGQGWFGFVRWPGWRWGRWVPLKNVERIYSVIRPRWWLRDGEEWIEQQHAPRSIR